MREIDFDPVSSVALASGPTLDLAYNSKLVLYLLLVV